jgi:hypothetical protein
MMKTYWFFYQWIEGGERLGENSLSFQAGSDKEAKQKVSQFMEALKEHSRSFYRDRRLEHRLIRITKEI